MTAPPPLPWGVRTAPERMILACTVSAWLVGALLWFAMACGFPGWHCAWKVVTGLPCAGCGTTRAVALLWHKHWHEALLLNPGAVLGLLGLAGMTVYAGSVVFLRLEPWRPSAALKFHWRWMAVVAFASNWLYLLVAGRV